MRALPIIRRPKASASVLKSGLGLGLAAATLAVTVTGAIFTDTTSVGGNQFSTGDVEISTSVASDLVSFTSPKMGLPRDEVTSDLWCLMVLQREDVHHAQAVPQGVP